MREQFEKLEEIAEKLKHVWWNEGRNQYCDTGKHPNSNGAFLNGAWYAYQEQQKKIDKALELGYEKRGNVHYLVDEHIDDIHGVLE